MVLHCPICKLTTNSWKYFKVKRVDGVYSAQVSTESITWSNISLTTDVAGTETVQFILMTICGKNFQLS